MENEKRKELVDIIQIIWLSILGIMLILAMTKYLNDIEDTTNLLKEESMKSLELQQEQIEILKNLEIKIKE